jgi:hypothetical protein
MRMIVCSGLFAMALLAAVLVAIGGHGPTWVAADGDRDTAQATSTVAH